MGIVPTNKDFAGFFSKLKARDERTWNILSFSLTRSVSNWIISKGITNSIEIQKICSDVFFVFLTNLEKLEFDNYNKLRNYVLSIASNKVYEYYREKRKGAVLNKEDINELRLEVVYEGALEKTPELVDYFFKQCNETEQKIIYKYYFEEKKMKLIAKELGLSEENCRLIKFRLFKRLRSKLNLLRENGLFNFFISLLWMTVIF